MDIIAEVNRNRVRSVEDLERECRGHFSIGLAFMVAIRRNLRFTQTVLELFRSVGLTLNEFLKVGFQNADQRQEFLAFYLGELKESVVGKAKCGCVHHAEDDIPCEHDLALLGPAPSVSVEKTEFNYIYDDTYPR